ncbi:PQQ-dependent sugar dehydrogenase [Dyadobacter frigoris]|uniref:PQQ-dependent sugar dehydrogenase n=1 Tax=Dyadobacter frigoris TaxID=2576211 RepID=UPI002554C199|nr:PQQ-dependent sugar dehydrogenase [Dyadobacter frigoris]
MNKTRTILWLCIAGVISFAFVVPLKSSVLPLKGGFNEKTLESGYKSDSIVRPDSSRFTYSSLVSGLDEPMEMAILPSYDVVVAERKGAVRYYSQSSKQLKTIAHFNVFSGIEDGLLGVAADPQFSINHWIYFYYGLAGEKSVSQLARFEMDGEKLIESSRKVLLEVPTQRKYCCHSAGYLTFDSKGLLYLSIGDNTNAEEIEGHNPTDERPGRELSDDQAATANSNSFKGKILRIKPESDGTFSIPDGNLFPKDGSQGKPEIYVMGVRNPFRFSVDAKNNYVYWGDVGPDTEINASEGKLNYDEINQARKPGFFGYPYFLGANEVFPKYDFVTKKEGPGKDPLHPLNESPHNTGIRELPAAQPAFIWYGKGPSKRWPLVGKGGASAMAGPVYYSDLFADSPYKLPDYYDGKLFIYDWIRKWIMAVTLDVNGNYVSMEPFLPQLKVVAPIDMQIAPDGAIYLLAYGTNWFARNTDSGIIRVEYAEGNRNPIASLKISKLVGAAPLSVSLSAGESKDYDPGDKLTYEWSIGSKKIKGERIGHVFTRPGIYNVVLTVTDQLGGKGSATTQVKVGNTPPEVKIQTAANRSFYWDNQKLDYQIQIKDREDKVADAKRTKASFHYLPFGKDLASVMSSSENVQFGQTEKLVASLDCKACHTVATKSIGPAFKAISMRYKGKKDAADPLSEKIIKGGSGNWGTYPMPPHQDLAIADARQISEYILSLAEEQVNIPLKGQFYLTDHIGKGDAGAYVLLGSYIDKGANGIEPLQASDQIVLRSPVIQMEDYDEGNVGVTIATQNTGFVSYISNITNGKFVRFNQIDLNGIGQIDFRVQREGQGGTIEVRLDDPQGPVVGSVEVEAGKVKDPKSEWEQRIAILSPEKGMHDLYIVFKNPTSQWGLFHVDLMKFQK